MRLFTQPKSFDKDQIVDLSIANGSCLTEQGIVTAGDVHRFGWTGFTGFFQDLHVNPE
jgi:hypothetical protein